MKFVFNNKSGRMEPEDWIEEDTQSPLENEIFSYLNEHPNLPTDQNYSTRSIAQVIINDLQLSYSLLNEIRTAVAKWSNSYNSSTEDLDDNIGDLAKKAIVDEVGKAADQLKKDIASESVACEKPQLKFKRK